MYQFLNNLIYKLSPIDTFPKQYQKETKEQIQSEAEKMWLIDQINNCAFPKFVSK